MAEKEGSLQARLSLINDVVSSADASMIGFKLRLTVRASFNKGPQRHRKSLPFVTLITTSIELKSGVDAVYICSSIGWKTQFASELV